MKTFKNQDSYTEILQPKRFGSEFIEIISKDEIDNCKKNFSKLIFDGQISPKEFVELDYNAFFEIIKNETSKFCKFYSLPDNNSFMTWGMIFSDNEDLKKDIDEFYLLSGDRFIKQNRNINEIRNSNDFFNFKRKIEDGTGNNNSCEMILYEREIILDYLNFMETLAELTDSKIDHLEFHHIYFKDFQRNDGAIVNYMQPKEKRLSFAVKTIFAVNKEVNRNLQDLLNSYYDAGDLKP